MKAFCFLNEDEIDNLPDDFKLIPFDASYVESKLSGTPKTLTSKKSPSAHKPSKPEGLGLSNQTPVDSPKQRHHLGANKSRLVQ